MRDIKDLLARLVSAAIQNLFLAQPTLSDFVPQDTNEREPNLSFHFANELWKYLFWLNCDFDVTKTAHENERPDLIFHKRATNALNFLVVEVKRDPHGVIQDLEKIKTHWFQGRLQYSFGVSLLVDDRAKTFTIRLLEWG